jgi:CYTH domain-containing protein
LKEITSDKSTYSIKINSTAENGELKIKIYNDKKTLFEKYGTINKTIIISNNDSKNVRIEITGKKATGHIKIKLT